MSSTSDTSRMSGSSISSSVSGSSVSHCKGDGPEIDERKIDEHKINKCVVKELYLKTYRQGAEVLIAVCDCEILGRRFAEGDLRLEVSCDFFGREKASASEVEAALARATMANFVGCRAVEHAISLGYVEKENVLSIDGVLCAQMVRF